jgi:hypothetical protein
LFKNSNSIFERPSVPFVSVANYSVEPLRSGYAAPELVSKIAENTAILAHSQGKGRVIASADDLAFRGYWHGSSKLLANVVFFGHLFNASAAEQ